MGERLAAQGATRDVEPVRELRSRTARMLAARPGWGAAALIGLVVIGYLWPVLFGGKLLSPGGLLYHMVPWKPLAPADLAYHLNRTLVDVPLADVPWRAFVRASLRAGRLPIWNPHAFAGVPFLANPQTGLYSAFSLPLWVLPFQYAFGVEAALKLWTAGFGAYLLVRQLGLGFLAGLLAAVAYAFSALNILWLTHETLPAVAALLPWIVWLIERILVRGRMRDALALALATAIALGGGHPGMQVHVLVGAGLYTALRLALARDRQSGRRARAALLVISGLSLGIALMAAMLVPEALSSHGTIGLAARSHGGTLPGSRMPLDALKTVVFPDWWGRPSTFELEGAAVRASSAAALANYNERTFYAGSIALLLALVGFLGRTHRRAAAPFAGLAAIGLAVAMHVPGIYWLATHLPLLADVQSQRLHFLFGFGVAIGAAFGLQAIVERPETPWRLAVPLCGVALALVAFLGAGAPFGDVGSAVRHLPTGRGVTTPGGLALMSIGWFVLFALGLAACLLACMRWPRRRIAIAVLVALLAVLDSYHFAHGYQPMASASEVRPPVTPAIRFLQAHRAEGRFVGLGTALLGEIATQYGLDDVRGYSPPQPTGRFFRLWQLANAGQTAWQPFALETVDAQALRVLSLLGTRWILNEPRAPLPFVGDGVLPRLIRVYEGPDAAIFENPQALPRAFVARAIQQTADEAGTLQALVAPEFVPRRVVVVERDQPAGDSLPSAGGSAAGHVRIAGDRDTRVTLRATLSRRALVVLADDFSDGWSVAVDGRPAAALHVDDVLRGVVVGPGRHRIVWSYAVPGLRVGAAISGAAVLCMLGCATGLVLRRRRTTRVRGQTRPGFAGLTRG